MATENTVPSDNKITGASGAISKCPFVSGGQPSGKNGDDPNLTWLPQGKTLKLQNYQTGQVVEVSGPMPADYNDCRHHVCTSTFMLLTPHPHQNLSLNENALDEVDSTAPGYVQKEAHDYLGIFHKDMETSDDEYKNRLAEVDREIKQTGKYKQTSNEIEYGVQLAWRNAPRCINRLYWRTMKVIDRRHVTTNDEMFKEICDHIRFAYNGGTLQTTVLALNPKSRLWSTHYYRYACYEQPDGSLLGDPMNRELTQVALEIGWNKPEKERTEWDILPIIVQVEPNVAPSWYELPEDLRLQVFLSHPDPKYDAAIKKLGLRWFPQPYVADKMIEIGGIFYRCVPFSGWFMQTEIGRNLCDVQRYNVIPKLAALLDLDISTAANSQLNVDRIYVEVNAAILYSFERAKTAIVDHHTAASGFQKFLKAEIKSRGNTPGDWVWMVPPISGGMSSVFHQEMINYVLKPRVLDQHNPWIHYKALQKRNKANEASKGEKTRHRWLMLRAARVVIGFALAAVKQRINVNVLYASANGTAQSYAQQLTARLLYIGYNPTMMTLDSYKFLQDTDTRSIVLVVTSTFGQGNAPDGGLNVEKWLEGETEPTDLSTTEQTTKRPLMWCTYAVCAIGSSAYPIFCGFGKLIDTKFELLGAKRLAPLATCDALSQQYKKYNEWEENIIQTLRKAYPHACLRAEGSDGSTADKSSADAQQSATVQLATRPEYILLEFHNETKKDLKPLEQNGPFTKDNPYVATVLQNIELIGDKNLSSAASPKDQKDLGQSSSSSAQNTDGEVEKHSVRLVTLETTGLSYAPGDHVCISPDNALSAVNNIILACGWKLDDKRLDQPCSLKKFTNGKYETLRDILTHFVDLTTSLRPRVLGILGTYAADAREKRELFELSKGTQLYEDWILNSPTVNEALQQFSSVEISLDELIQLLPKLQPRYYSISSSTRFNQNELHVTVSVVTYITPSHVTRHGICSTYLQQTVPVLSEEGKMVDQSSREKASKVRLFISPNIHFRLPGQESLSMDLTPKIAINDQTFIPLNSPMLMFAIGSGIAPFRSFWQELQVLKRLKKVDDVTRALFMGCRSQVDFVFAQELQSLSSAAKEGEKIFDTVIPVYSRGNAGAKRYVQHAMLEHEELIYSVLTHPNGFIYMCGSTRACQGIEASLTSILQTFGSTKSYITMQEANRSIAQMKEKGSIKQDMFG